MTEWIKCTDKPPPKDRPILVWDGHYTTGGTVLYNDKTGNLLDCGPTWDFTHWAEQPEPPYD